ncbi:MAG: hypothetical protein AB7Y46_17500, partial [Armatimonadota bacterium]
MRHMVVALLLAGMGAALGQDAPEAQGQIVMARAIWPGQDLTNTSFRVFADQEMRQLVDVFPAGGPDGGAIMGLRPGEYYIMAVVDVNGNDRVDAGDGFGFHGVEDVSAQSRPRPLTVRADALNVVAIPILMTMGEDGRLLAIPGVTRVRDGHVIGSVAGAEGLVVVVLVPVAEGGHAVAGLVGEDGSFRLSAPPGHYRLCALSDATGDGILGTGDLLATRGWGEEQPLEVLSDSEAGLSALTLAATPQPPAGVPPIVVGRIIGAQAQEGATIQVAFCSDAALRQEAFSVAAGADGRFAAAPAPGTYYVRVTVDQAGDGQLGVGDMMGFFGVADLLGEETPKPVALPAG